MTTYRQPGAVGTAASPVPHLPSPRAPADLRSEVRWKSSEAIVVQVTGEIDTCTAARLESAVRDHLHDRPATLRVDMGEVSFLGAAGLRALHRALLLADDAGVHLVVDAGGSLAVRRALDLLDRICAASSSRA